MLTLEWLSAFIPLGVMRSPSEWIPLGAGVLFHEPPAVWLVTANHVVNSAKGGGITPLVTKRSGGIAPVGIQEIQHQHGYAWHSDEEKDIAVTLMPVNPEWQIKAINERLCIKVSELVPSMGCYTVGCPYGVRGFDPLRATPLVLDGIVSGLDPGSGHIYTSVPTFPGNSGGPIIVRRDPFNPAGRLTVRTPILVLAGILLEVRLVSSPGPTSPASLPPLHLGVGITIEAALDLIRSPGARRDRERVLAK